MKSSKLLLIAVLLVTSAPRLAGQAGPSNVLTGDQIVERVSPSAVTILVGKGDGLLAAIGSGLIIRPEGVILTAHHLIAGMREVQVRLKNGEIYDQVELIASDERRDAAALRIPAVGLPALPVGAAASVSPGATVFVVSTGAGLPWTASSGILSAMRMADEVPGAGSGYRLLQFTAPLAPGSSGGVLVDSQAHALGMVIASITPGQNVNFAVPIDSIAGLAAVSGGKPFGSGSKLQMPNAPKAYATPAAERPKLDVAIQAARWIESSAMHMPNGTAWPADPRDAKSVQINLYSGTPGVVLFYLELYRATRNHAYLGTARSGAEYLIASMPDVKGFGLYEGLAGIGFTLAETYKVTADRKFQRAAMQCAGRIRSAAISRGKGLDWGDTTDIISGSAGTGLFLLYAAREFKDIQARECALQAGLRLVELGKPENGGLKWAMSPAYASLMPNFSHGTAGISYFLATLYMETKRRELLDAALSGAKYLQSIANTAGDACLIFHHEPGGQDLFYLGWCHGPTGTGRLFYRLYQVTGDAQWLEWLKKTGRSLLQSGIPEKQTPGFWNNVSQCCGSAGVAEFALDMYRVTGETAYLEFAQRLTADLLSKATRDAHGTRWIQAEHRVKPDFLVAQTGLMQGAAGIGMWLLHLDAFERGAKSWFRLPDSPF